MTRHGDSPAALPAGRVAAIDYGRRRIGVAICDAERILASPHAVRIDSGDRDREADYFRRLAADEQIVGFIVGLPLHTDGRPSPMSAEAEAFGGWLNRETGLPVVFHDERYTSAEAAGRLGGHGLTRAKKKARSDAIAAQVVLENWLAASGEAK